MSLDSKHFCDIICAYLAVLCWYEVVPTDGMHPLLLQCFISGKFESMYFRSVRVVALATRHSAFVRHYLAITQNIHVH